MKESQTRTAVPAAVARAQSEAMARLQEEVITCRRCPRLVAWREQVAQEKTRRFAHEQYWGKPVPAFGDPLARLLIVGLAPAAHGGNRTGRMFTGDRSGDWLYRALHKFGFANQPLSRDRDDGLKLCDCLISATCRCAPPQNKPTREEILQCRPFLQQEVQLLLPRLRVVVALGRIGFESALAVLAPPDRGVPHRAPRFAHGAEIKLSPHLTLLASFHPSQQNTFTGRLTEAMFDAVFRRARRLLERAD